MKLMVRACLTILFVGCSTLGALAQSAKINGHVVEARDGEPLPGANVVAKASSGQLSGAVVDSTGGYVVNRLSAGSYVVTATFVGYAEEHRTVDLETGETVTIDFRLEPTVITEGQVIVSSVSRRAQKAVDAPAAVSVLEGKALERPVLTPVEHLKGLPGVDVVSIGLNQSRVAVRGFNNVIDNADRLLILTDYRNTRLPSVRINNFQLIPTINEDVERVEVVSGPGSALYGPNAANGVMHIITKSPFDSQGTTVDVGFGERDVFMTSFRHAGLASPKLAYKISGRYYRGNDWEYQDPLEPDSLVRGRYTLEGRVNEDGLVSNARDNQIENGSVDARIDMRPLPDLEVVMAGGIATTSSINLTVAGAAQYKDWKEGYVKGQATYRNLFVQAFWNRGDLDNAYLLRTGDQLVEKSSLYVGQIQHRLNLADGRQKLTYGADAFLTRPNTGFTIDGRNEETDNMNEFGAYVQSETRVKDDLDFVAALRLDDHSELENPILSPRAAVVYRASPNHTFRATYNRAFTTPASPVLFLDINLAPSLGPLPFPLQGLGVPASGFNFRRDSGGGIDGLYMQSPFNPAGITEFIPADAASMWGAIVAIFAAQDVDISAIPAPTSGDVATSLAVLNTGTFAFDPVDPGNIQNIGRPIATVTNSFELGYKGLLGQRVYFEADAYYNVINDPLSSLNVYTPSVFFDQASLTTYLEQYMPSEDAAGLAAGIAQIPVGTVTSSEAGALNPAALILSFRNFDDSISLYGGDLGMTYFLCEGLRLSGNYSVVSEDLFKKKGKQLEDIALNAPKNKVSAAVQYTDSGRRFDGQVRLRYVDGFPVRSGAFVGEVDPYTVLDLNVGIGVPSVEQLRINLTVQNVLNNKHQEWVATPEIGRLALVQLSAAL